MEVVESAITQPPTWPRDDGTGLSALESTSSPLRPPPPPPPQQQQPPAAAAAAVAAGGSASMADPASRSMPSSSYQPQQLPIPAPLQLSQPNLSSLSTTPRTFRQPAPAPAAAAAPPPAAPAPAPAHASRPTVSASVTASAAGPVRFARLHKAATIIQAAWRGFWVRCTDMQTATIRREIRTRRAEKQINMLMHSTQSMHEQIVHGEELRRLQQEAIRMLWDEVKALTAEKDRVTLREQNKAAVVIQRYWRGYAARKVWGPALRHRLLGE